MQPSKNLHKPILSKPLIWKIHKLQVSHVSESNYHFQCIHFFPVFVRDLIYQRHFERLIKVPSNLLLVTGDRIDRAGWPRQLLFGRVRHNASINLLRILIQNEIFCAFIRTLIIDKIQYRKRKSPSWLRSTFISKRPSIIHLRFCCCW